MESCRSLQDFGSDAMGEKKENIISWKITFMLPMRSCILPKVLNFYFGIKEVGNYWNILFLIKITPIEVDMLNFGNS